MAYADMVASKTIKELVAMKRSLESSSDDVGCFSACDPQLLGAVEAELEKRACETTADYWDCQCEGFCLHSKAQDLCSRCGARREDSPRSRAVLVAEAMQDLIAALQCLNDDDVGWVLDNALLPEMRIRLAGRWSAKSKP